MKKVVIIGGIIISILLTLTGCSTKESEVKKIEKEADVAVINYLKNANNQPIANNRDTNEKYTVKYTDMYTDEGPCIIVYGYKNNEQIWEYKSKTDTIGAQFSSIGFIKHDANIGIVLIHELNTIKALDDQSGKEKWTFNDFEGFSTYGVLDSMGNSYIYSFDPQRVYVIDQNGKLEKCLEISKLVSDWPETEAIPIVINGLDSIEMENDDERKIAVTYAIIREYDIDGKMISRIYDEKMIIDTINETAIVETIGVTEMEI